MSLDNNKPGKYELFFPLRLFFRKYLPANMHTVWGCSSSPFDRPHSPPPPPGGGGFTWYTTDTTTSTLFTADDSPHSSMASSVHILVHQQALALEGKFFQALESPVTY